MRDISIAAYKAFVNKKPFRRNNTHVWVDNDGDVYMSLFGHCIARTLEGRILINHCGYPTATTVDRLKQFGVKLRRSRGTIIVNESFVMKEGWLDINNIH